MATKKVSELTALTSPDGAEELLINDGGTSKKITIDNIFNQDINVTGTVTIDQDTDNEALIIDSESTSDNAVQIFGKYPLIATQDISSGYAAYFYRNIAEAGSNPLVYINDTHTSNTQPALKIIQDGAGIGLQIDQNGDNRAIYLDSESTSHNVIYALGKYGIQCIQDISGGYVAYFYRNIDEAGSSPLVTIDADHTSNTQPALKIKQDGAGYGLHIDQNGDDAAIYIDSESANNNAIESYSKWGIYSKCDISGGRAGYFERNLDEAGSYALVTIKDDHANNVQPTLAIQQDGAGLGLYIDQNGNNHAIYIDSEATTGSGVVVYADALTTGKAAYFYSNSADTSTRNLVYINNDHASATGTTALYVQQDSTGLAANLDGAVTINESGADVDFRVEGSGYASALFVNGADGKVTMQGATTTIGSNAAATNVEFNLNGVASKAQRIQFQESGTSRWLLGQGAASETTAFELYNCAGTIAIQVDRTSNDVTISGGNLVIGTAGKGIDFSATTDGTTMSSELLDDYEEGESTVAITCSTSGTVTLKSTHNKCVYTKVGRVVHFNMHLRVDSVSSPVGGANITGLPFSCSNDDKFRSAATVVPIWNFVSTAGSVAMAYVTNNSTTMAFLLYNGDTGGFAAAGYFQADSEVYITGSYIAA